MGYDLAKYDLKKQIKREHFVLPLLYTIIFVIMFYCCFGRSYQIAGKSYIWSGDGLSHSYASYVYFHSFVRHLLRNIFIEHNFVVPTWDYSIGYGSDILPTIGLGIYNPLYLMTTALTPKAYLETMFNLTVICKFYTVGICYLVFAKYRKHNDFAALAGAIVYTFCTTTSVGLSHVGFLNTFYIFPLIMMGADRLWEKKTSKLYVISLAIALLNNFYFLYMIGIILFMYCLQKYIIYGYHGRNARGFIELVVKFIINSMIAAGIAAIDYIPVILSLIKQDRLGIDRIIPLFYDKSYYASIFQGFIDTYDSARDWYIGFGGITLLFVVLFILWTSKRHLLLRIGFFEMTLGMCIPYFGHVMNGFSYVNNRWIFAYLFCCAYIVTVMFEEARRLPVKRLVLGAFVLVGYGLVGAFYFKLVNARFITTIIVTILLMIAIIFIVKKRFPIAVYRSSVLIMIMISVWLSSYFHYKPDQNFHILNSVVKGSANDLLELSNAQPLISDVDRTIGARYDSTGIGYVRNASWVWGNGLSCMDMYINLYNNNIDLMNKHLAIVTEPFSFSYKGINRRSELEALYGVKYFTIMEGDERWLPIGYSKLYREGIVGTGNCRVYTADSDIGMAYLYDDAVDHDLYMTMNPEQRQQIITQAVVIEDAGESAVTPQISDDRVSYTLSEESPMSLDLAHLESRPEHNQLVLKLDESIDVIDSEWYVCFENLQNIGNVLESYSVGVELFADGESCGYLGFTNNTPQSHMYGQKHDWMLNFGLIDKKCDTAVITFHSNADFSADDIAVYRRPEALIRKTIENLDKPGELLTYDNEMVVDVNADTDKWLFVAEPYSEGWKATIDGAKAEVHKADDAFMAIRVPAGTHTVRFRFHSPGFFAGLVITIVSIVLYILLYRALYGKTKGKAKKAER